MNMSLEKVPHRTIQYPRVPTGLDIGNSSVKACFDLEHQRIPSLYAPLSRDVDAVPPAKNGGMVTYISGDRPDLIGKTWLGGHPAYSYDPTAALQVSSRNQNKSDYALQLMLAAMAPLKHRDEWELVITASVHDAPTYRDELMAKLPGTHTVVFSGDRQSVIFVSEDLQVLNEGQATPFALDRSEFDVDGLLVQFDIGYGTVITSVFDGKQLIKREITDNGVKALVTAIANNTEARSHLGGTDADHQTVIAGLENGTLHYGNPKRSNSWSFKDIYTIELKRWIETVLAQAVSSSRKYSANADTMIAIGGGARLPHVGGLLKTIDVSIPDSPEWCNAKGLHAYSSARTRRFK